MAPCAENAILRCSGLRCIGLWQCADFVSEPGSTRKRPSQANMILPTQGGDVLGVAVRAVFRVKPGYREKMWALSVPL